MRYLLRYLLNIQSIRATYAKMDSRFNKKLGVLLCENFVVYFRIIFFHRIYLGVRDANPRHYDQWPILRML